MSYAAARACLLFYKVNANAWSNQRTLIALNQLFLNKTNNAKLVIDGIYGQKTADALYIYNTTILNVVKNYWPRQADVPSYFGEVGANQVFVTLPYLMYGDYERKIKVTQFSVHKKVAASVKRIFNQTLHHYGLQEIRRLNLDIFSGCLNVRRITGGSGWSMHSWGIGIDIDAAHNQFDQQASEGAAFAKPIYAPFVSFWEAEGWVSLGRARNYDWMHFQAARL
jgi:hypothetical protein